jgi:hypothetical protein
MRVDDLITHGDDVGNTVGEFYGTSIREVYELAQELREIADTQRRVRDSLGLEALIPDVVLFPGEVVHGNVIRRDTTAEFLGEVFYTQEMPEGRQIPLHKGLEQNQKVGTLITWRPGNQDIAVLHEEVASELSL